MDFRRITIKDVAKHLNLSASTVSRALNDKEGISDETKALIIEAADKLGYKRNPIGSFFRLGITKTVGVMVPEMITPFAAQVVDGIQEILNEHGYRTIIVQSNEDPLRERENLHLLESFMVDGIIVCPCHHSENNNEFVRLQNSGLPIVFYDRLPYRIDVTHVGVDDYASSFFLVEYLILKGRRKIVYIQGPDHIYNSRERKRGYVDALKKYKIEVDDSLIVKTGMTFDDGKWAIELMKNNNVDFDAVFAFTETLALGAMNRLQEHRVSIPKDVAVCSFSGTVLSTIAFPQLTTVEQPLTEMGRTAAELILEKTAKPRQANKKIILNAKMITRASTEDDV